MTSKTANQKAIEASNRAYFKALAVTRGSLDRLSLMVVVLIICLAISNVGPLSWFAGSHESEAFAWIITLNLALICMSAPVLVFAPLKALIYRFQVLFSTVLAAMALGWVYCLCLLALPLATFSKAWGKQASADAFVAAGLIAVVLMVGSTVVHALLLRRRLQVGHSKERTGGNFYAVSASNRSKTFWILFGVVAIVPNVLTLGEYLVNSIGGLGLLLLVCVLPSLPVEFAYLAFLKSRDRLYWEKRPVKR